MLLYSTACTTAKSPSRRTKRYVGGLLGGLGQDPSGVYNLAEGYCILSDGKHLIMKGDMTVDSGLLRQLLLRRAANSQPGTFWGDTRSALN